MKQKNGTNSKVQAIDSRLRNFVTYRISKVQAKLNMQASRILSKTSGITINHWRIIALVGAAGQTQSSVLSKEAALDKGLLSRNLKTLIKDGVVKAEINAIDHRIQDLSLTKKGAAIYEKTLPVTLERQAKLREGLTDEELRIFIKILDHLENAAEK